MARAMLACALLAGARPAYAAAIESGSGTQAIAVEFSNAFTNIVSVETTSIASAT